jgi:hypothetical protein
LNVLTGVCHCGAASWAFDGKPEGATACNCTVCRRYGVLWIYGYEGVDVRVSGATREYSRGTAIDFHFCPVCGCVVFYRAKKRDADGRQKIAVNVRLSEPGAVADIPIDHFDGFDKFDDLPRDGKCVRDYWF